MFLQLKLYLLIFALFASSLVLTACPKSDPVRKAVEASYRLPGLTNDVTDATRDAFNSGVISLNQKNRIAPALQKMAEAEIEFVKLTDALRLAYEATGTPDAGKLGALTRLFDERIVAPFVEVLENVKLLSGTGAAAVLAATGAVRLLLLTIGHGFKSSAVQTLKGGN